MKPNRTRIEELQQFLQACPFNRFSGFEITSLDDEAGWLQMNMPVRREFQRLPDSDQVHGGPIAALIDTAGCLAVVMKIGVAVPTIAFSTNYLRRATGGHLLARAQIIRAGRSVATVDIEVTGGDGQLVAIGRAMYSTSRGSDHSTR